MQFLNKIELRGIIGRCNVQTISDTKMAKLCVVTEYAYKTTDETPVIETTWHNVTAWEGRKCKNVETLKKGDKVHLVGRIRYQKFTDAEGIDKVSTDIIASSLEIIED